MAKDVYRYAHCTTGTLVKEGPGVLHSLVVSAASGSDATVTVYDETSGSGDVMAVVTSKEARTACALLDVAFGVGCYVNVSGTGAKATVAYR
jgi:hypothetical protein